MKKISLICLVLMLCLAVIGVGYGSWSKNLYIVGTTSTGEVDIAFDNTVSPPQASDNEKPWPGQTTPDVGTISVNLTDSDSDGDMDAMSVILDHGYYCYEGYVAFYVWNNGTVPVWVTNTITEPAGDVLDVVLYGIGTGINLNPGEFLPCTLVAHVTTNTHGTLGFGVTIDAVQYNEAGGAE